MNRRNFIKSMLIAASAPAIVRASSIMPVSMPIARLRHGVLDVYFDIATKAYDNAMSDVIWTPVQQHLPVIDKFDLVGLNDSEYLLTKGA